MDRLAVSVIVASLGRPRELDRCLAGLRRLVYRPFEVVVVACAEGRAAIARHAGLPWVRVIPNERGGVAAARNDGIAAAGGEVVAFLDDDAVPEPLWLDHLIGGMEATGAAAATGYVRGRNGISFQWRGRRIARDGGLSELGLPEDAPVVPGAGAVMLEGTNMALRRRALAEVGGFDPRFRFYLDDADMALRLAAAGLATVVVPLAEVHHGFAASARRRADRTPTDLRDVGRSLAVFLGKHLWPGERAAAMGWHREAERRRLLRAMVDGRCDPRDVGRLLAGFDAGAREGAAIPPAAPVMLGTAASGVFRNDPPGPSRVIAGRTWRARALRAEAARAAEAGGTVSLCLLDPTARFHRLRFDAAGYWEQAGGLFGRSERTDPLFRRWRFADRLARECDRVAKVRGMQENTAVRASPGTGPE